MRKPFSPEEKAGVRYYVDHAFSVLANAWGPCILNRCQTVQCVFSPLLSGLWRWWQWHPARRRSFPQGFQRVRRGSITHAVRPAHPSSRPRLRLRARGRGFRVWGAWCPRPGPGQRYEPLKFPEQSSFDRISGAARVTPLPAGPSFSVPSLRGRLAWSKSCLRNFASSSSPRFLPFLPRPSPRINFHPAAATSAPVGRTATAASDLKHPRRWAPLPKRVVGEGLPRGYSPERESLEPFRRGYLLATRFVCVMCDEYMNTVCV